MNLGVGVLVALASQTAHADGVYFQQLFGLGSSESPLIGKTIQTRAGVGARIDGLAIEAWVANDAAAEREGALFGIVGGEPVRKTDLASYGVSLRTIVPIRRTPTSTLDAYTRIDGGVVEATGRLDGYGGTVVGAGGGLAVRGRVRALGFVWAPLFWMRRGPHVTGALFVDYGYQRMDLARGDRELVTRGTHLRMGFAVGSAF